MHTIEPNPSSAVSKSKPDAEQPFFPPSMQAGKESGIMRSSTGGSPFFQLRPQPLVQAKLQVNTPGDQYEQQADAVADQVMRMRAGDAPIVQRMPLQPMSGVMRMCSECSAGHEEEKEVQRKESSGAGGQSAPPIVSQVLSSGGGQAMDRGTQQLMESRFGQDFSPVRIHTDSKAAESASAIQARAYTSGNHVVFGKGEYQPGSEGGKRLLAHELVHTIQQGGIGLKVQRDELEAPALETSPELIAGTVTPREDRAVLRLNYAFFFTGGGYGTSAREYFERFHPQHIRVGAHSFEEMFDRLYRDVARLQSRRQEVHIDEIVIVTHANSAGGLQIPLTRDDVRRRRNFTPWDLSELQEEFQDRTNAAWRRRQQFRHRRSRVVAQAIDRHTDVIVRGCEFGQSQDGLDALRSFFGGNVHLWAPRGYQGYEVAGIGTSHIQSAEEAFSFLQERGLIPQDLELSPQEQRVYMARELGIRDRVPTQFFVMGNEDHDRLRALIQSGEGLSESTEASGIRVRVPEVETPSLGEYWGLSSDAGRDPELNSLSLEEIERRAQILHDHYRPEFAPMLLRLMNAWERHPDSLTRALEDTSGDPLAGLPPIGIFGDSNLLSIDAAQFEAYRPGDMFEMETLPFAPPSETEQQEANRMTDLSGEVDAPASSEPRGAHMPTGHPSTATSPNGSSTRPQRDRRGRRIATREELAAASDFSKSRTRPANPPEQTAASSDSPLIENTPPPVSSTEGSFQLPGITRQFTPVESILIQTSLQTGNPVLAGILNSALIATALTDSTVGIGIQGGGNAVAGASAGGGIVIRGGRIIGLYGSLAGNVGVTIGLSAEFQVTIVAGGLENFTGESVALTVGGGELLVGHASLILNTQREIIGVSASGGIGAGLTAIEGFMTYQGTVAPSQ